MTDDNDAPESDYDIEDRNAADFGIFSEDNRVSSGSFFSRLNLTVNHAKLAGRADPAAAAHPWIARGPRNVGGRIRTIAQDPQEPRRIYAGSAFGGLWRTENSGETWAPVDLDGATSYPMGAIGICYRKPNCFYVGTGEPIAGQFSGDGLFYTDDGGTTFQHLLDGRDAQGAWRYERIVVDPWDEERCWMATHKGLMRREPGGGFTQDLINGPGMPSTTRQDVTDIAIDFGNKNVDPRPVDRIYTIYVGVRATRQDMTNGNPGFGTLVSGGVYRTTFNPATQTYTAWEQMGGAVFPFPIRPDGLKLSSTTADDERETNWKLRVSQRIKLSICENVPNTVYMVAGLKDDRVSNVFRTDDGGANWTECAAPPVDRATQASYALFVSAHPDDPEICFTGCLDVFRTLDGGASWTMALDSDAFRKGDRAQHADIHDVIFDRRDPRRIWMCNDHGISESQTLGDRWRMRSFGIQATQFYDLTTHPTYPWIMAGGYQDNGSWISYGGNSWIYCGIADGGAVGFMPGQTDIFLTSTQGSVTRTRIEYTWETSLRPTTLGPVTAGPNGYRIRLGNRLADQPTRIEGGVTQYPYAVAQVDRAGGGVNGSGEADIFGRKLVAHPTRTNHFVAGDRGRIYVATSGDLNPDVETLAWTVQSDAHSNVPTFNDAEGKGISVTAMAYAPSDPDTDWWIGTETGQVFFTHDAGVHWHDVTARVAAPITDADGTKMISDIQVHPRNSDIVVITHGRDDQNITISATARNRSGTGTAADPFVPTSTWRTVSHVSTNTVGGLGVHSLQMPTASPVTRAAFDGDPALASSSSSDLTIYVSTIAGVYVSRTVRADGSGANDWHTFNEQLPLVLLRDLEYGHSLNGDGTVRRKFLRAGTYGRGVYECDLSTGAPDARLLIRNSIIEDSHAYEPGQTVTHDPRLKPAGGSEVPIDLTRSIDIRIDPPPYSDLGDILDAVEFDEDLRSEDLVLGETNFIYVQVHTHGHDTLNGVEVHLFFASAPGTPPIAPDLNPNFWTTFPAAPPAASNWSKAGMATLDNLHSGQSRVARIPWVPPTDLGENVALLAMATHAQDRLDGLAGPDQPTRSVHPSAGILPNAIAVAERRVGLYITPTQTVAPDVFIRDALDDTGDPGAVAWGGRGPDIIVTQGPVADPAIDFANIHDLRPNDRIQGGQNNFVYVRGFNRSRSTQNILIDVYFVPYGSLADSSTWQQVGGATATRQLIDVPPNGHDITVPIVWQASDIPDPAPSSTHKTMIMIALLGTAGDPMPDPSGITSLAEFWAFFRAAENANNACFRAMTYEP